MSPLELVGDFDAIAKELRVVPAGRLGRSSRARGRPRAGRAEGAALDVPPAVDAGSCSGSRPRRCSRRSSPPASPGRPGTQATQAARPPVVHGASSAGAQGSPALRAAQGEKALNDGPAIVPAASPARLQRYEATLRLRVKNVDSLSSATKRAMALARSLGGYVGEVQYSTHAGKRGDARVVLRVPVGTVQAALAKLTGLGTILQQQTGILDVTKRVDREARQIARLERELETATPQEAPAIRARLGTLQAKHRRLLRSASLARIVVTLTTPAEQAAAPPGRLHRTLDDATGVLVRELQFLLYALVVAGPLLLLGAAGVAAARAQRRRADTKLLERA